MPLRDERRGRRATIGSGATPLRAAFVAINPTTPVTPAETPIGVDAEDVRHESEPDPSSDAAPATASAAPERGGSTVEATSHVPFHANASSDANQRRSLLEPSAVLMTLVQPLFALRTACIRLMRLPLAPTDVDRSADSASTLDSTPNLISERSFASEVASLLQLPVAPETVRERPLPNATALDERLANTLPHDQPSATAVPHDARSAVPHDERSTTAVPHDARPATAVPHDARPATAVPLGAKPATEVTLEGNAHECEPSDSLKGYTSADAPSESDVSASETRVRQNITVVPLSSRLERVVPITRLPLRPHGLAITWTADVPEFAQSGARSRAERHALLERLIRDSACVPSEVIARAYREEDGEGRTLALRVLLRNDPQAGRSAFIEALRVGSDDERALAVDGLAAIGARDALTPAFADRIDAIAAKAALSYVGTLARSDYRVQLAPFIDEKHIDTILTLLAGIVE